MSVLVFLYIRTHLLFFFFFFFNDTATTEIYTLSLHDALPISIWKLAVTAPPPGGDPGGRRQSLPPRGRPPRAQTARSRPRIRPAGTPPGPGCIPASHPCIHRTRYTGRASAT